jgi:hypothetical protein
VRQDRVVLGHPSIIATGGMPEMLMRVDVHGGPCGGGRLGRCPDPEIVRNRGS